MTGRIKSIVSMAVPLVLLLAAGVVFYIYQYRENKIEDADQIKYLIGISQANLTENWRIVINEEIKKQVERHKEVQVMFSDAVQNSSKQITDVEKMLDQGIDLLMISPVDSKLLNPVIEKAFQKIPVIVLDTEIENENYTLFIGVDNRQIGIEAAQMVYELLGAKGGNVIEVQGLDGSPPVIERSIGFKKTLEKYSNIKIVQTVAADWMRDKAEDIMKEIFSGYPDVDVVFAHSDAMALGAYIAAEKMRVKNIRFIGIDGLPGLNGGMDLIGRGILEGTFINTTGGKEAVDYAIRILTGEKGLPKRITLKSSRVTKENLDTVK